MGTKAAVVLLLARDNNTLLRVLPSKHLPRRKKNGPGMTKGLAKPWDAPGGKLEDGETAEQGMKRELLEETGLTLDTATKIGETYIPDCKCAVFVYSVASKLTARPLDGISQISWIPIDEACDEACFRFERALFVGHGLTQSGRSVLENESLIRIRTDQ